MGNMKLSPNPSKNKQKEDETTNINNEIVKQSAKQIIQKQEHIVAEKEI